MKHMKHLIMLAGACAVAAAGYMAYQHYYGAHEEVKTQGGFCLGLCGEGKDGHGGGIGFGASDKGPLILAGPWGHNQTEENNETMMDKDTEGDKPEKKSHHNAKNHHSKNQHSKRHNKYSDDENVAVQFQPYDPFAY